MLVMTRMNAKRDVQRAERLLEGVPCERVWRAVKLHDREVFLVRGDLDEFEGKGIPVDRIDEIGGTAGKHLLALRTWKNEDTVVEVAGTKIGGRHSPVIAGGPCIIMDLPQIIRDLTLVKEADGDLGRGGCRKPREGPYDDRGLGETAFMYLAEAGQKVQIGTVTECDRVSDIPFFFEYGIDMIQIGKVNAQNFVLLEAVAKAVVEYAETTGTRQKAILLKRGPGCTVGEWLSAAEYLLAIGVENLVLCERGIRTWDESDKGVRYTFDIEGMKKAKRDSHLPIGADASHAGGVTPKVLEIIDEVLLDMEMRNGLGMPNFWLIEATEEPGRLTCDAKQQLLLPDQFGTTVKEIRRAV